MKKSLLAAAVMSLFLAACGGEQAPAEASAASEASAPVVEASAPEASAPAVEASAPAASDASAAQ